MPSLRELYESGQTCPEIAAALGCSVSTVWLRLKKQGTKFRSRGKEVSLDIGVAVQMYQKGSSCAEIGRQFHCDSKVVQRRLKTAGVEMHPIGSWSRTSLDDALVQEQYATGVSARGLAETHGCNHGTILRHLREKRTAIKSAAEVNRKDFDETTIKQAYVAGKSLDEIALQMGCSTTPIRDRLRRAGIEAHPSGGQAGFKIPLNEDQLLELYVKQGLPTTALQNTFHCSYATIIKRLRGMGLDIRGPGSYARKPVDPGTIVDLYLEGWSAERVARHLGCSTHLVLDRLSEEGVPKRSGSPHGGICVCQGVVVKTDSGWESHVYPILRREFGEDLLFQGERGDRLHKRTLPVLLDKPAQVRAVYLPERKQYRWTPDFYLPSLDLYLEVKGWPGLDKWDSVIVPSIVHTKIPIHVAVLTTSPYQIKTWSALQKALRFL